MKENMQDNFSKLQTRVLDSLAKSDLVKIRKILSSIDEPTIITGSGGSSVVSLFMAKVLNAKNHIICESVLPRDLLYRDLTGYRNIVAASYGGFNYGVDVSFDNDLNKYLLARNYREGVTNIKYEADLENSFISLSATLIPMTILLAYYLDGDLSIIYDIIEERTTEEIKICLAYLEILEQKFIECVKGSDVFEIMSGHDTSVAARFLESTFTESGLAIPVVHDKYDYCHGRSNLSYNYDNNLIFFDTGTELDQLYLKELPKYYKNIIPFKRGYKDDIINDYYFTYLCMVLAKKIAEIKEKDLSRVDYSPIVKKIYRYKGGM